MPSESIAAFLDLAREKNLFGGESVDELFRQPDVPQQNLSALCDFLQNRGVLTGYQAAMIRAGKGYELNFAGYPILDEVGPCPGGTAFKGMHPSLRTPVIVRRLRTEWFAPLDNASAYIQRAQDAAPIFHPQLAQLLDAGVHRDEAFAVLEPFDGADLESLIGDIGPMPAALAGEFVHQAALALQVAHLRGVAHGDLRPSHLFAGPLVPSSRTRPDGSTRLRPAPDATVKVFELGLVPNRDGTPGDPYFAPEARFRTPEADIFALGGTLAFLLTGQPPTHPKLLEAQRPDAPLALVELAVAMMAEDPNHRPTASEVVARLKPQSPVPAPHQQPSTESSSILGGGESQHLGVAEVTGADVELAEADNVELAEVAQPMPYSEYHPPVFVPAPAAYTPDAWSREPASFVPHSDHSDDSIPTPRVAAIRKPIDRSKVLLWVGLGLGLNLLAVAIWASLFFGLFESSPESDTKPDPTNSQPKNPPKPNNKKTRPPV